ncbi:hypothetical protein BGZ83_001957, partial [Gryganskiella cystojenkinii]
RRGDDLYSSLVDNRYTRHSLSAVIFIKAPIIVSIYLLPSRLVHNFIVIISRPNISTAEPVAASLSMGATTTTLASNITSTTVDIELRTSMERHLMDRDREGQLYLEARRQQVHQDLLENNRISFLSTITPPSTNPSSAASSLFHEPIQDTTVSSLPEINTSSFQIDIISSTTSPSATASSATPDLNDNAARVTRSVPTLSNNSNNNSQSSPSTAIVSTAPTTASGTTATASIAVASSSLPQPQSFQQQHHLQPLFAVGLKGGVTGATVGSKEATTRQRSGSGRGRTLPIIDPHRPILPISPSSLEYQLTASLLSYPQQLGGASATLVPASKSRSRSRSRPRQGKTRRDGGKDQENERKQRERGKEQGNNPPGARADSRHRHQNSNGTNGTEKSLNGTEPAMTTTTNMSSTDPLAPEEDTQPQEPKITSVPLPAIPPSPPLPPLPPKSPRSLIAHYFPTSLPPPPARGRAKTGTKESLQAPMPLKTPTFGPAIYASSSAAKDAPPVPSPSASFNYIPSANLSHSSSITGATARIQQADLDNYSARPSTPASSTHNVTGPIPIRVQQIHHLQRLQQQHRLPSDVDIFLSHQQQANSLNPDKREGPPVTPSVRVGMGPTLDKTANLLFAPVRPRSPSTSHFLQDLTAAGSGSSSPTTAQVVYPKGLLPTAHRSEYYPPVIIRLQHQKPVPYVRDPLPGETSSENGHLVRGSTNTSHDLEMVIEEITGRIRTNRTSLDPWPYDVDPCEQKPLPKVQAERGQRYWVFRDVYNGTIVPGPLFFLFGHVFPPLWWIGSLYPATRHPEQARQFDEPEESLPSLPLSVESVSQQSPGWQKRIRALATSFVRISKIARPSRPTHSSPRVTTSCISNASSDPNGSTLGAQMSAAAAGSSPEDLAKLEIVPDRRHGPWSTDDHASSLFEQRLEYDQKILRYELDLRWKKLNLIWSVGSFVIAIAVTAILVGSH